MSDDFTYQIMRQTIVKIGQKVGIKSISELSVDILTDFVIHHISSLAEQAGQLAAQSGRTDTNCIDVFFILDQVGETPLKLAEFTNEAMPLPDFLVEPYPLPRRMKFYDQQVPRDRIAFQPNSTINFMPTMEGNPSIPGFFPPFPAPFTYGNTMAADDVGDEDLDSRQEEQRKIKEAIAEMAGLVDGRDNKMQEIDMRLELDQPPRHGAMVQMGQGRHDIPQMTGMRPVENPEFLKPEDEQTDTMNNLRNSRETREMVAILLAAKDASDATAKKNKKGNE